MTCIGLLVLLGCHSSVNQKQGLSESAAELPQKDVELVDAHAAKVETIDNDSIYTCDTVNGNPSAPGLWARVSTVDYMLFDTFLDAEARHTARMKVEGFSGNQLLMVADLRGGWEGYLGPCWFTAVASDGKLWILNCTENVVGMGAAAPVSTFCLDGSGNEVNGLAPIFDTYTQTALLQLDGRRVLEGGRILDMKSRKWIDLKGGPGKGFASDTLNEHALLVIGHEKNEERLNAYFFSLPDLKRRLFFPCNCAGESGSSEGIYGNWSGAAFELTDGEKTFKVDIDKWAVDSASAGDSH